MTNRFQQALGFTTITASFLTFGSIAFTPTTVAALTLSTSNCNNSTVTAIDEGGVSYNYTACGGAFTGNDTGAGRPLETALENGELFGALLASYNIIDWVQYGKSDESGDLDADNGSASGDWSVATKIDGPFVISFKAGNENSGGGWSAFLFDNVSDIVSGTFNTLGVAVNPNNGRGRGLSHASLFVPIFAQTPPGDDDTPPGDDDTPPGDDDTPPGDDDTPPGDDDTPPGDDDTPPGDDDTPPGDDDTPPGDDDTPPGDDDTPPGDDDTPPGDDDTPPGDDDTPPGDDDTPPGDDDTPPGDDDTPPGEDDTPPGDDDTPPGEPPVEEVPEPMTILGTGAAVGFGAWMKRRKQNNKA